MLNFFFGQAISQKNSKPPIVKGFYLLRIIIFVGLRKGNCRNVIGEMEKY